VPAIPRVELLLTGNELMTGDTIDSNSAMLARYLLEHGIEVQRKITVGDSLEELAAELTAMTARASVVIINGGLGPTRDDLTAVAVASVASSAIEEQAAARRHVELWCAQRSLPLNAANLKQALLPAGAHLIDNSVGSAVGFAIHIGQCLVLATPGVPSELRAMLAGLMEHIGAQLGALQPHPTLRLQTFGLGESPAQQLINEHLPDWPAEVSLGFRAGAPLLEIKLAIADPAHEALQQACRRDLYALFGDHIIGEGETTLASCLVALLRERGARVTTAESCTGGLIASLLTQVPGSSSVFEAGFVSYANHIKQDVLGVAAADLARHGAVSETVVRQMAEGALRRSGATYAIAVSGIAGPDGGTPEKPAGTVWIAWGGQHSIQTTCLLWPAPRTLFQTLIAAAGLDLLRRELLGIRAVPQYCRLRRHPRG